MAAKIGYLAPRSTEPTKDANRHTVAQGRRPAKTLPLSVTPRCFNLARLRHAVLSQRWCSTDRSCALASPVMQESGFCRREGTNRSRSPPYHLLILVCFQLKTGYNHSSSCRDTRHQRRGTEPHSVALLRVASPFMQIAVSSTNLARVFNG